MDKNFTQSKTYSAFAQLLLVAKCACAVIRCYMTNQAPEAAGALPFNTLMGSFKGREQVRFLPGVPFLMSATRAKKTFKKRFGQANHLLITALVGLDAIETGEVSKKPESFSTSWNPIEPKRSAERARIFTLKSFLGWAVESLEMYLTELNRKPKELESEELTAETVKTFV